MSEALGEGQNKHFSVMFAKAGAMQGTIIKKGGAPIG